LAGRTAEALPILQRSLEEKPNDIPIHRFLIHALVLLGRLEEARRLALRLLEARPDYTVDSNLRLRAALYSPAFMAEHRAALITAGLPE
jgi:tetratricopeptide (TPR) repeat protein